jgi:hypothetical protein
MAGDGAGAHSTGTRVHDVTVAVAELAWMSPSMVKHGALSKSHVYHLLRSKDARVRHAAFTLLERSNPRLRTNSELFVEITRFIWDANPSYDVYQEFTKRHFQVSYKVHELISARVKTEKQEKQSAASDDLTDNTRHYEGGFFKRLFRRRSGRTNANAILCCSTGGSPTSRSSQKSNRFQMKSKQPHGPPMTLGLDVPPTLLARADEVIK